MKDIDELCSILDSYAEKYSKYRKIVIVGAGFQGKMACQELSGGRADVLTVCDNDENTHTKRYWWLENEQRWIACQSFEVLKLLPDDVLCVITANRYYREIGMQLEHLGVKQYISYRNYVRCFHSGQIRKAYNSLQRQESKETICGLLQADIEYDDKYYQMIYRDSQYFAIPEFQGINNRETFFEAGAYVGDVLEEYIWRRKGSFHKIYAFEPGKKQFEAMKCRMERVEREWAISEGKINLVRAALGAQKGTAGYVENDDLHNTTINYRTAPGQEENIIEVECMDSYYDRETVSLVIADIEGDEKNMILGMKRIIERDKPRMAISVYHRPNDIWEIMELIHNLNNNYKFDMFHHTNQSCEETVLYCY